MYTVKLKPIPKGSSIPATNKKNLEKHKAHHSDKHYFEVNENEYAQRKYF
jgi:hypothetical protein